MKILFVILGILTLSIEAKALTIKRDLWDNFFAIPPLEESLLRVDYSNTQAIDESHINILVWNMYKAKNPSWSKDFEQLAKESDLLMLQEVYWQEPMQKSFESAALLMDMAISFVSQKTQDPTGVANASRVDIEETKIFRSSFKETLVKTPKMIAASKIYFPRSAKTLLLVNIHGVNFVKSSALGHQLLEVAALVKNHQGPVVFAGDFNAWSKEKTELVQNIMKSLHLTEVPFSEDNRKRTFGYPLDYIFYRDLKLKSSFSYGDIEGSDHTPMRAIFSL